MLFTPPINQYIKQIHGKKRRKCKELNNMFFYCFFCYTLTTSLPTEYDKGTTNINNSQRFCPEKSKHHYDTL